MEYEEKLPEDYDGIMPDKEISTIEFRNVSFSYKEDSTPVVKNLSLIIKEIPIQPWLDITVQERQP